MLISNFTEFVARATLTTQDLNQWITSQKQLQSGKSQLIDTTNYNQHSQHSDTSTHSETLHKNTTTHSDSSHRNTSTHSDTAHSNTTVNTGYSQEVQHADNTGTHSNTPPHSQAVHGDTTSGGIHTQTASGHNQEATGHSEANHSKYTAHSDSHTDGHKETAHSNNENHSDTAHSNTDPHSDSPHRNNSTHSESTPHTDTGFDHSNYVPAAPAILNISPNAQVRDIFNVGVYSYDKNIDGYGSQDAVSKTVKYVVQIRQLQDRNGTSKVSSWVTLMNGTTPNQFQFNSYDPLKQGITDRFACEGLYELKAYAYNDSISIKGVTKTYIGPTTTMSFKIIQNIDPVVDILNGGEFISHNFGLDGSVINNAFTAYENKYANAPASQKQGIFVEISIKDPDLTDGHTATVYLEDSNGNMLTSTKVSAVITGSNPNKKAIAFIPKGQYLNINYVIGANLVVEVKDYSNNNMSTPAGAHIILKKTSLTGTLMKLNIDSIKPTVSFTQNNPLWVQQQSVTMATTDVGLGLKEAYYQIVRKGETYNNSNWLSISVATGVQSVVLKDEGEWQIWVKSIDKAQNTTIQQSGVYKIAPITLRISTNPAYPGSIPITENLFTQVRTECLVDIPRVDVYITENQSGTKTPLSTSNSGRNKDWSGYVNIPRMTADKDYVLEAVAYRSDGSFEKITTPIKVFTPISSAFKYTPIFELNKVPDMIITNSKYVSETKVKLFVGTPYETPYINAQSLGMIDGKQEWVINYVVPSNIPVQNYTVIVESYLPWGKKETITTQLIYMSVQYELKHTNEWEENRKAFNIYKTGNQENPRSKNIFFNGEKFVFDVKVKTGSTSVYPRRVEVTLKPTAEQQGMFIALNKDATGYNWTGEMYNSKFKYAWAKKNVYNLEFDVFLELNNGVTKNYSIQGVVDSNESYWRGHTKD